MLFKLYFDGGSRGNPGLGAWCYTIFDDQGMIEQESGTLNDVTNNVAEYTAITKGLRSLVNLGAKRAIVVGDSQLVINQMKGKWQVKSENLKKLYLEAVCLASLVGEVQYEWKPRENSYVAMCDKGCNDAMDRV